MGKIMGQKVVIIDTQNETISDFITLSNPASSFRPVGLGFSPDGNTLYLASIEKEVIRNVNPLGGVLPSASDYPFLQTGTIWKITKLPEKVAKSNESENKNISSFPSSFSSIIAPYSGNNSTDILKDK
jgi:DNA-binding beta-propeller fold protein YncE